MAQKSSKLIQGNCSTLFNIATEVQSFFFKFNFRQKKVLLEIPLPAKQVTSVAFGGPNLDILFVTTAATARDGPQSPQAGQLFKVTGLGVKGLPGVNVRV